MKDLKENLHVWLSELIMATFAGKVEECFFSKDKILGFSRRERDFVINSALEKKFITRVYPHHSHCLELTEAGLEIYWMIAAQLNKI